MSASTFNGAGMRSCHESFLLCGAEPPSGRSPLVFGMFKLDEYSVEPPRPPHAIETPPSES
eukprot:scaffold7341_cov22-Tisochrysis_lutea.AAC.1